MAQAMRDHIAEHPGLTREALWRAAAEFPEAKVRVAKPRSSFQQALKKMLLDDELRERDGRLYPTQRLRATPKSQ